MKLICKYCGAISEAGEIDYTTISECCHNRQQRRHYRSIMNQNGTPRWYRCPKCHKDSYANCWMPTKEG